MTKRTRHDLPPLWDCEPVMWHGWSPPEMRTTLAFHLPADALACNQCGAIDENYCNFGSRVPQTDTEPEIVARYITPGNLDEVVRLVPARPVRNLVAFRCRHCCHDRVHDLRTNQTWDLEPDDYTDAGSTPPDTLF